MDGSSDNNPLNKASSRQDDSGTDTCGPSTCSTGHEDCHHVSSDLQIQQEVQNCQVEACSESASTAEFPQNRHVESASLPNTVASPTIQVEGFAKKSPTGTTTKESLHASAQQVIEEINAKRKQDTQILADFKKALELHVSKTCNTIEEHMFRTYDSQGKLIQSKLQELFATLDRIAQLETELHQFKQALQVLYQEMQHGN